MRLYLLSDHAAAADADRELLAGSRDPLERGLP